jgi:hypothetical protein
MTQIDLSRAVWRRANRSQQGGNCVEVANLSQVIAVRDSKNPGGAKLIFSDESWRWFADRVKRGRYEL